MEMLIIWKKGCKGKSLSGQFKGVERKKVTAHIRRGHMG
jgi:hypothetical protein